MSVAISLKAPSGARVTAAYISLPMLHLAEGKTFSDVENWVDRNHQRSDLVSRMRSTYAVTTLPKSGVSASHTKRVVDMDSSEVDYKWDEFLKNLVLLDGLGSLEIRYKRIPRGLDAPSALRPSWQLNEGTLTEVCEVPIEC